MQCSKWTSYKKKNKSERKTRSAKRRAGENNPVCNRSLTNSWAWQKAQTLNRWAGKPSERPEWLHCSAASRDGPLCTPGDSRARSRDTCHRSQQRLQHTRWWKSHRHHAHTAQAATRFLSGAEKGIGNTLKLNSWCVTHTYMCVACLRMWLILWPCVIWVTAEFREPN